MEENTCINCGRPCSSESCFCSDACEYESIEKEFSHWYPEPEEWDELKEKEQ